MVYVKSSDSCSAEGQVLAHTNKSTGKLNLGANVTRIPDVRCLTFAVVNLIT